MIVIIWQLALEIPLEIPRGDQPIMTLLAKIGQAVVDVATSKGDTLVLIALLRFSRLPLQIIFCSLH